MFIKYKNKYNYKNNCIFNFKNMLDKKSIEDIKTLKNKFLELVKENFWEKIIIIDLK